MPCTTAPCSSNPRCLQIPCVHYGPFRAGTLCHRKDGNHWHGQQEDRDHAGLAAVDNEAVVAKAALGGRDGACITLGDHMVRRLVCVVCSCSSRLTSRIVRDLCVRSVLVPHHWATSGLPPCRAVQSPVFANVCKHRAWSAAAASRGS